MNDGLCLRQRAERPNHIWSYMSAPDRTHNGRFYITLNIIDEYTKSNLKGRVNLKLTSIDVFDELTDLFIPHQVLECIPSDHASDFIAKKGQDWTTAVGAKTAFIEKGSPWENGH